MKMNNEGYNFTVINKEGMEVTCDVISMVADADSKIYLLYTDYLLDDKGNFRLLASELVEKNKDFILQDIKDKKKLKEIIDSSKSLYQKQLEKSNA